MAASERQRPQLHVDMRLTTEDEPDIRMNVISKKRRLRYALMEDSSDEEDNEFETQQPAGQEPFEGNYQHTQFSVSYPKENQEEQFVLPPSEHGSSSSESGSDDEEEEVYKPSSRHQSFMMMQPPVQDYANEDDLFDAAFVAPENRFPPKNSGGKENAQRDSISSMNQIRQNPFHRNAEPQVFDLCASDEDTDFTAQQYHATFLGVRREDKSPRFNANSRRVFSPHAVARRQSANPPTTNSIDNDDDIVECWSSEDEGGNSKPRARRVTNEPPKGSHPNDFASRNPVARSTFHSNDDEDDFDRMPAPSRQKSVLHHFKADRSDRKRRLRDATTGMHSAASIPVSRTANPTFRNDLHGGSGVGIGNYTFSAGQSFQQSFQQPVAPVATGGKRKKAATKKSAGKKKGGGGKRSYYRKKGGGKRYNNNNNKSSSSSRGGGGRGRGQSKRGAGSNEEYSRKDPLLKNVGGASIIF